jgi:hypothetical protein
MLLGKTSMTVRPGYFNVKANANLSEDLESYQLLISTSFMAVCAHSIKQVSITSIQHASCQPATGLSRFRVCAVL